jgi:hypothetical protein
MQDKSRQRAEMERVNVTTRNFSVISGSQRTCGLHTFKTLNYGRYIFYANDDEPFCDRVKELKKAEFFKSSVAC